VAFVMGFMGLKGLELVIEKLFTKKTIPLSKPKRKKPKRSR